ncbi:MAG: cell envelope integrity protein CreD [Bacteroidota bacterium]
MKEDTLAEKISAGIKNSVTLKLITILILVLLLLIPASMIRGIINERQALNDQASKEVSAKWAKSQEILGPILTIPILYETKGKNGEAIETVEYWNTLPENLEVAGTIDPKQLSRGIYEVVVYSSRLEFTGDFKLKAPVHAGLKEIQYDKAFLSIGISDLRGIKNQIEVAWDEKQLAVEPGSRIPGLIDAGITVPLSKQLNASALQYTFSFNLDLQGSENLSFVPIGSQTSVKLQSDWNSPSFNGNFLPDSRTIDKHGFTAAWNVLQLNRNYPQSWIGEHTSKRNALSASAFGVDFILPLDNYQKEIRSSKYAIMTISLTFLVFFLVEILNKRKIHPFQYTLVGLALCLFYVLLVSITEHVNFNFAFGISVAGIVSMISLYSLNIFKSKKLSLLLSLILFGLYGFLFVTLQLADFALLLGGLGLTTMLGLTMYFTRKINWYQLNIEVK